jgi:hypothetical protein
MLTFSSTVYILPYMPNIFLRVPEAAVWASVSGVGLLSYLMNRPLHYAIDHVPSLLVYVNRVHRKEEGIQWGCHAGSAGCHGVPPLVGVTWSSCAQAPTAYPVHAVNQRERERNRERGGDRAEVMEEAPATEGSAPAAFSGGGAERDGG